MSQDTFAFYKKDKKWIVESENDSKFERSEHTSRLKAMLAFFGRHPGLKVFYVVITKGAFDGNTNKE